MDNIRGWSNDPNVTLGHRVLTWVAEYQPDSPGLASVGAVAEALQASADEVSIIVDNFASEGLAIEGKTYGVESSIAGLTSTGLALASDMAAKRASTKDRRRACRDAVLDFLYANDKRPHLDAPDFLADPRSYFWGERFTVDDWQEALKFLANEKLISGMLVGNRRRFIRPIIVHRGRVCVENYNSDVVAFTSPLSAPSNVTTTTIANSPGAQWMSDSPGAQQTATVTISQDNRQQLLQIADQIAEQIVGLPAEVATTVNAGVEELRQAATPDHPDEGWVKAALGKIALSVAVAVGTDEGRKIIDLIGHAGQLLGS